MQQYLIVETHEVGVAAKYEPRLEVALSNLHLENLQTFHHMIIIIVANYKATECTRRTEIYLLSANLHK